MESSITFGTSSSADEGRVDWSERGEEERSEEYRFLTLLEGCKLFGTSIGLPQNVKTRSKSPRLFDVLDFKSNNERLGISSMMSESPRGSGEGSHFDRNARSSWRAARKSQGLSSVSEVIVQKREED